MKFKKFLAVTLIGAAILSTGCSTEKNIPQEASQSNVENAIDPVENLDEEVEEVEETESEQGLTLDFIQEPEEFIVFYKENLDNLNELNQEYYRVMQENSTKTNGDIPERAKEIVSQMEAEFESRKRIDDTNLIKFVYDEIITLKAEKINPEIATDFYDHILFGFDFVDNKELGRDGNSKEEYIRYLAVMKNNQIFIPILEDHGDHDHIYYATATITEEFFNELEEMLSEY